VLADTKSLIEPVYSCRDTPNDGNTGYAIDEALHNGAL
jgi:hypothetical protein